LIERALHTIGQGVAELRERVGGGNTPQS